jgi:hypothetical protein
MLRNGGKVMFRVHVYDTSEKMVKARKCMFYHETWGPHPGCAEFMDSPEVWTCSDPAEFVVKYPERRLVMPLGDVFTFEAEKSVVCAFHAKYEKSRNKGTKVYRFRYAYKQRNHR